MNYEVIILNGASSHQWRGKKFRPALRLWGCNGAYQYWDLHGCCAVDHEAQQDLLKNFQGLRLTNKRRLIAGFTQWPAPGLDSGSLLANYVLNNSDLDCVCIGLDHHWQAQTQQGTAQRPLSRHGHQLWQRAWSEIISNPRFHIVTDQDCSGQLWQIPQAEAILLAKNTSIINI